MWPIQSDSSRALSTVRTVFDHEEKDENLMPVSLDG